MGGQLDGIFLAGSLPHEFIILIVTLFICLWLINFSLSLSLSLSLSSSPYSQPFPFPSLCPFPLITAGGSGQRYSSPSGSAAKGIFVQLTAQNLQIFKHYFKFFAWNSGAAALEAPGLCPFHPIATPLFIIIIIICTLV